MQDVILQIDNLGKQYQDFWAVKNLSLTVRQGEIYGFLGRNGAGKTTTIRMIMSLIRPTEGKITLFGKAQSEWGKDLFRQIGVTIEYPGFYPSLTARENLLIYARMMCVTNDRINEVLAYMGIEKAANQQVRRFSLGMKQRLGLARALLHKPKLIILDEPTNGLDPAGILEIRGMIKHLAEEERITFFVSSHILSEVEKMATRIGIIHQGSLVEEVDLATLQKEEQSYVELRVDDSERAVKLLQDRLGSKNVLTLSQQSIRIQLNDEKSETINRLLHEHGFAVPHFALHRETLEDRFMKLTGGKEKE